MNFFLLISIPDSFKMRPLLVTYLFVSIAWGAQVGYSQELKNGPYLVFDFEDYDFGQIVQGEKVEVLFNLANSGNKPLIISNVLTSCGCTASQWPETPVKAGGSAKIRVKFDSQGKIGFQRKIITVLSNAINDRKEISIQAHVLPNRAEIR